MSIIFMSINDAKGTRDDLSLSPVSAIRPSRFIGKLSVIDRVGLSYTTIWQRMVDGTFPRSRDLGGRTAWLESEIDEWIANRPHRRLKGDR